MVGQNEPPSQHQQAVRTVVAHMMTPGVVQVPGDVSVSEAALLLTQAARSPGDLAMYDYAEAIAAGARPDPRLAEGT